MQVLHSIAPFNILCYLLCTNFVLLLLFKEIKSRLVVEVKKANSLLDFYYSIGSLVLVKVVIFQFKLISLIESSFIFCSVQGLADFLE